MGWLLVAALAAGAALAGWTGGRIAALVAATIILVWTVTAGLVATGQDGIEGFFDCGVRCTSMQDTVAFVFFYAPIMLVVLLLGSLAGWLARRGAR